MRAPARKRHLTPCRRGYVRRRNRPRVALRLKLCPSLFGSVLIAPAILGGALHRFIAWIDLPHWVKDGPILSQARSRSKGPMSDQVADAPNSRGQCRSWVASRDSMAIPRTAGIGASRPLRRIPAIVSFLNPQPALSFRNGSSYPFPAIAPRPDQRRAWVAICSWHPGCPPSVIRSLNGPSGTLPRFRA